jgi:hypothetical protein
MGAFEEISLGTGFRFFPMRGKLGTSSNKYLIILIISILMTIAYC